MPATKPKRPPPGHAIVVPRVDDDDTQRALDRIKVTLGQLQATAANGPSGRILGVQVLSGSGTATLAVGTCVVHLRGIGQGGGGGGAVGGGAGSGGSSGVMLDIWIGTPGVLLAASITFSAGSAGGGGGNNAGTNGAAGSDSTITINRIAYTMKGGSGGTGAPSGAVLNAAICPVPASGTSTGGVVSWGLGDSSFASPGVVGFSGYGGTTAMGAGGAALIANGAGNAGSAAGFGGGGSGGLGGAGGAGAAGGFVIEEYS